MIPYKTLGIVAISIVFGSVIGGVISWLSFPTVTYRRSPLDLPGWQAEIVLRDHKKTTLQLPMQAIVVDDGFIYIEVRGGANFRYSPMEIETLTLSRSP